MTQEPSSLADVIAAQVSALQSEREQMVTRIFEIDEKLVGIAGHLGIELPSEKTPLPRLALPTEGANKRHNGSLPDVMMELLLAADRGYSRSELKQMMRESSAGATVLKNENTYYNAVKRYVQADKIVVIDDLLYHPDRAPLPDGQEDPSGAHLTSNVSTLFSSERRAINVGD